MQPTGLSLCLAARLVLLIPQIPIRIIHDISSRALLDCLGARCRFLGHGSWTCLNYARGRVASGPLTDGIGPVVDLAMVAAGISRCGDNVED